MRPMQGLGVADDSVIRLHREERRKVSPCFPKKGGPYVDHVVKGKCIIFCIYKFNAE